MLDDKAQVDLLFAAGSCCCMAHATAACACTYTFNRNAMQLSDMCLQKLEAEHAEQLQIVMTVVSRMEKVEAELRAMQEQQAQRQQSKWGIFSLQGR